MLYPVTSVALVRVTLPMDEPNEWKVQNWMVSLWMITNVGHGHPCFISYLLALQQIATMLVS